MQHNSGAGRGNALLCSDKLDSSWHSKYHQKVFDALEIDFSSRQTSLVLFVGRREGAWVMHLLL